MASRILRCLDFPDAFGYICCNIAVLNSEREQGGGSEQAVPDGVRCEFCQKLLLIALKVGSVHLRLSSDTPLVQEVNESGHTRLVPTGRGCMCLGGLGVVQVGIDESVKGDVRVLAQLSWQVDTRIP